MRHTDLQIKCDSPPVFACINYNEPQNYKAFETLYIERSRMMSGLEQYLFGVQDVILHLQMALNVRVHDETWERLNQRKKPGDTFDDVVVRLLDETGNQ